MEEVMKCPECGGNRFNELGDGMYKCLYCGTTFHYMKKKEDNSNINETNMSQEGLGSPIPMEKNYYYQAHRGEKSKTVAAILAILFGGFGIHKFYLKQPGWGIAYIIFCWSYIPAIIGFIEGIIMLCMSNREFDEKYN